MARAEWRVLGGALPININIRNLMNIVHALRGAYRVERTEWRVPGDPNTTTH